MKTLEQLSDEALAEYARRNPQDAQSRRAATVLFARYYSRVYIWAMRYVHDHDRAMDITQDVFLNAWRKLSTYRGRARFFAWIFTITRNRCLNAIRQPSLLRDEGVEVDQMSTPQPLPDRELEERLDEEELQSLARETLDRQEHDAIYLRCYERLPIGEITTFLGVSDATGARTVLQRARRKLRDALIKRRRDLAQPLIHSGSTSGGDR